MHSARGRRQAPNPARGQALPFAASGGPHDALLVISGAVFAAGPADLDLPREAGLRPRAGEVDAGYASTVLLNRLRSALGSAPDPEDRPAPSRAEWALVLAWMAALLAVVLTRPDDQGLLRGAQDAGAWAEHRNRADIAWRFFSQSESLTPWLAGSDASYPPGLHAVSTLLGALVGHGGVAVLRVQVLWSLLLASAGAGLAWRLGGWRAALAAGAVVLGLPACLGASTVYHYDLLSISLVCAGVAVLAAGQDRWGPLSGGVAGALFGGACLVKWSAPFFGVPLVAGALLLPLAPGRRSPALRVVSAVACGAVALWVVDSFLGLTSTSFDNMLQLSYGGAGMGAPGGVGDALAATREALANAHAEERPPREWFERWLLPFRFVTSTAGPLLFGFLLLGGARWLLADRRGAALQLVATPLLWFVLLAVIDKPDDRWLLALLPTAGVAVGLAWSTLGPRSRALWAVLWMGSSLWVAWDFHHAQRAHPHAEHWYRTYDLPDHFTWAGLGSDSIMDKGSGWLRRDHSGPRVWLPQREAVWERLMAEEPARVLVMDPGIQELLEPTWWDFRNFVQALEDGGPLRWIAQLDGQHYSGDLREGVMVVVAPEGAEPPWQHAGVPLENLCRAAAFPGPEPESVHAVLWAPCP